MFPITDQSGHTSLMRAALDGQAKIVNALLKNGADVNAIDHEGRTALMFAVINLHSAVVSMLLDDGADVNVQAKDGGTALMLAVCSNAADIVRMLIDKGADLSGRFTVTNLTALVIAEERGCTEIIDLLKKATVRDSPATATQEMMSKGRSSLSRLSAGGGGDQR